MLLCPPNSLDPRRRPLRRKWWLEVQAATSKAKILSGHGNLILYEQLTRVLGNAHYYSVKGQFEPLHCIALHCIGQEFISSHRIQPLLKSTFPGTQHFSGATAWHSSTTRCHSATVAQRFVCLSYAVLTWSHETNKQKTLRFTEGKRKDSAFPP